MALCDDCKQPIMVHDGKYIWHVNANNQRCAGSEKRVPGDLERRP